MNREEQSKLKFDRRLRHRPGWVSQSDLDTEVEKLGDSAENVAEEEADDLAQATMPEAGGPVT